MIQKWIATIVCALFLCGSVFSVFAESPSPRTSATPSRTTQSLRGEDGENTAEDANTEEDAEGTTEDEEEQPTEKPKDFSSIIAPNAIVMDIQSGYILFEKNSLKQAFPGDLVKMMTGLLVVEQCDMNDIVTVSQTVIDSIDVYQHSTIALEVGEQASVKDLLYAIMLPSADDAAIALAEHVAGSEQAFVELMNKKAQELGMKNTRFVNASGIFNEGQVTTAQDMAILAREVMKQDLLVQAVKTPTFDFSATNTRTNPSTYYNNNYLVSAFITPHYFYDNAIGVKNGYTEQGKYTLAAAASNGKGDILTVVMGNERDKETEEITSYNDAAMIFDYVFENYAYTTIINANQIIREYDVPNAKGDGHVLLLCPTTKESFLPKNFSTDDVTFNVKLNRELAAPIKKGEVLGTAEVVYNNQVISTIELVSDRDLSRSLFKKLGFFKYVFFVIALIFLGMLGLRTYNMNQRKKRKRRSHVERNVQGTKQLNSATDTPRRQEGKNDSEVRRRMALERTARNLERSAQLTSDRARMRADLRLSRELDRHREPEWKKKSESKED